MKLVAKCLATECLSTKLQVLVYGPFPLKTMTKILQHESSKQSGQPLKMTTMIQHENRKQIGQPLKKMATMLQNEKSKQRRATEEEEDSNAIIWNSTHRGQPLKKMTTMLQHKKCTQSGQPLNKMTTMLQCYNMKTVSIVGSNYRNDHIATAWKQ